MISDIVARELHISHGWPREFVDNLAPYYLATLTNMSRGGATPVFQVIDEMWHALSAIGSLFVGLLLVCVSGIARFSR